MLYGIIEPVTVLVLRRTGKAVLFGCSAIMLCWGWSLTMIIYIYVTYILSYAPINVNPVGGGGLRARGGDLMPETIPFVGLLIV